MKKLSLLMAPLASVALLASCAITIKFGVFVMEGGGMITDRVTITKDEAAKGKDFSAEIVITEGVEATLPEALTKVEAGNKELKDGEYTYKLQDGSKKANFKIPGQYVEGIINIYLDLEENVSKCS
ncbi:MAG: hypothetical protein MJ206_00345 [Bacilli bacterium]|nr:hypothetical protein [Bacilli bacterium]